MTTSRLRIILGCLLVAAGLSLAQASDTAKEKRWADQIVDELIDGEAVWLQAGDRQFLAIHTEHSSDAPKGAAIILHGLGVHPNWPDVVYPLRTQLPERGWTTLSLQMPILANEAEFDEYAPLMVEVPPRIDAAVAFLKQQGIDDVVLIGHSIGGKMAVYHIASGASSVADIQAVVAVGLNARETVHESLDTALVLENVTLPILDLMGSEDNADVKDTAELRRDAAATAGNRRYEQKALPGANHFHVGKEAQLVDAVDAWISGAAGG